MKPLTIKLIGAAIVILAAACILVFVNGCENTHTAPVSRLLILRWTAPGDDGLIGQASKYEAKIATDSMQLKNSWATCTTIPAFNTKVPAPGGSRDSLQFSVLTETGVTYYIAVKTADEVPNWSAISVLYSVKWDDVDGPAQITDLTGTRL